MYRIINMNTEDLILFIGTTPKKLKDVRPGVCINESEKTMY